MHAHLLVWVRLQQPRAPERRPGDKPEKNIELARCYCYIAPVCFRITNASFPARGYCSLHSHAARYRRVGRDTRGGHIRLTDN